MAVRPKLLQDLTVMAAFALVGNGLRSEWHYRETLRATATVVGEVPADAGLSSMAERSNTNALERFSKTETTGE